MPGDPGLAFLARLQTRNTTLAQLQAVRVAFGVNTDMPIWVQYGQYMNNLLHGDLGVSYTNFPQSVTSVIGEHLPWTIGLLGVAVIVSAVVGTLIGMLVAWRRGSWLDSIVPPFLTFISAIPYFWMALALLYLFGFLLGWFPISGGYDVGSDINPGWNMDFLASVSQHALLPIVTLVVGALAGWVLTMRNTMVTTLSEDYVLMAQAKGLPERRVIFNYAARNAILPSITSFAMSLGLIVNGAILTEMVFSYPGIGMTLYNAIEGLDYTLVQGCFLVIAFTVLGANFLSELLYTFLDPRVRQRKG